MRGALLIVILLALLIGGYLTMKNMGENVDSKTGKVQAIDKAEDAAKGVEDKLNDITKQMQQTR